MGKTNSKHAEITDSGVVNSNFIVEQEAIQAPLDIRILLYILTGAVVLLLVLKLKQMYRRTLKKDLSRNMYLRTAPRDPEAI